MKSCDFTVLFACFLFPGILYCSRDYCLF